MGRSDLHRLRPHTWPLPRDHFHRPGSGELPCPGSAPSSVPGSQAQGPVISGGTSGAAPLASPDLVAPRSPKDPCTWSQSARSAAGAWVRDGARGKVHEGLSGLQAGGRGESARARARQVRPAGRGGRRARGWRGGRARPAAVRVVCAAPAPGFRRPPRRKPRPRARPVPARWSGCSARRGGSARRRPGAGKRAERRTAPRPRHAPGFRCGGSAPDWSGPAAARTFPMGSSHLLNKGLPSSVRPRGAAFPAAGAGGAGPRGRAGRARAGFVCECACAPASARRGRGRGRRSACAGCCVRRRPGAGPGSGPRGPPRAGCCARVRACAAAPPARPPAQVTQRAGP